jgi:hypothetical protein
MRQLWIHRNVEILQNRLTCYLYSSRQCPIDRHEITQEWNKIKKDMDEILVEMDIEVISKKMYERDRDAIQDNSGKPR